MEPHKPAVVIEPLNDAEASAAGAEADNLVVVSVPVSLTGVGVVPSPDGAAPTLQMVAVLPPGIVNVRSIRTGPQDLGFDPTKTFAGTVPLRLILHRAALTPELRARLKARASWGTDVPPLPDLLGNKNSPPDDA